MFGYLMSRNVVNHKGESFVEIATSALPPVITRPLYDVLGIEMRRAVSPTSSVHRKGHPDYVRRVGVVRATDGAYHLVIALPHGVSSRGLTAVTRKLAEGLKKAGVFKHVDLEPPTRIKVGDFPRSNPTRFKGRHTPRTAH